MIMEDLNKAFDKKFGGNYKEKGKTHKVQDLDIYKNVKDFIRQREKELLNEVIEKIRAYKISGKLPEEEQRINALLEEIIEDDIQPLKKIGTI